MWAARWNGATPLGSSMSGACGPRAVSRLHAHLRRLGQLSARWRSHLEPMPERHRLAHWPFGRCRAPGVMRTAGERDVRRGGCRPFVVDPGRRLQQAAATRCPPHRARLRGGHAHRRHLAAAARGLLAVHKVLAKQKHNDSLAAFKEVFDTTSIESIPFACKLAEHPTEMSATAATLVLDMTLLTNRMVSAAAHLRTHPFMRTATPPRYPSQKCTRTGPSA